MYSIVLVHMCMSYEMYKDVLYWVALVLYDGTGVLLREK